MSNSLSFLATSEWMTTARTWLTSTLVHGNLLHLGANLLCLSSFGNQFDTFSLIESFTLGAVWCGAAVALFSNIGGIGASGAICGLFGALVRLST